MSAAQISPETFAFLKKLAKNNNRDWFNKNKETYIHAHENVIAFADMLLAEMRKHDNIETASGKNALMRIYRDTRFSKDKTPYKIHFAGGFKRATKKLRGGYYFSISPGNTLVAGGFYGPEPNDLALIRQDIDYNYKDWKKLLANKKLKGTFSELVGEKVNSAPRGYAKDHPAIEILKHKQFFFVKKFTDAQVLKPGFYKEMNKAFKDLRVFFDYMSEVLGSNSNGEADQ
ncbi:MAG: DUF2461 domain-containing protein [Sphingobacteriaceae bacterium]|nr:DUF2461 domain-containing protein [Sphingobacteriaceae bacterium]